MYGNISTHFSNTVNQHKKLQNIEIFKTTDDMFKKGAPMFEEGQP